MEHQEDNSEIDEVLNQALSLLNQPPPICTGICFCGAVCYGSI